ncbi:MAG: LytTR family DNA-binding domain-containing protein [Sporolactobacillus sp.]
MKVLLEIDSTYQEEWLKLHIRQLSEQAAQIQQLAEGGPALRETIVATKAERSYILQQPEISHLVADNGMTRLFSENETYELRESLKSLERRLNRSSFVRISKFCIANLSWIDCFEAGFSGNLLIHFKNGMKETVSRRYVPELKKKLVY